MADVTPVPTRHKLGDTLPPGDIHAVSASLPTWDATVGWATRDEKIIDLMRTGYPRFFIHRMIALLACKIQQRFGNSIVSNGGTTCADSGQNEGHHDLQQNAMLFPCRQYAIRCEKYLRAGHLDVDAVQYSVLATGSIGDLGMQSVNWDMAELHVVFYPSGLQSLAKSFWQHTGFGISSRYAEFCLKHFEELGIQDELKADSRGSVAKEIRKSAENHRNKSDDMGDAKVKAVLRQRIAELASTSALKLDETAVYVFPSGMAAISHIAETVGGFNDANSIVAYGFLYLDTFKVLSRVYGFESTLYGNSTEPELAEFEVQLEKGLRICALFCEFPGNPLLRAPDLRRLRRLADKYDFVLVCDDTVGTFVNIDVLHLVDVLCTSLTKMFSGACNVMGGSVVLNPRGKNYEILKNKLSANGVDAYYPSDVAIMEINSRDLVIRVQRANANAEMICDLLAPHWAITKIYYPSLSDTREIYDSCKRPEGGYGYLLSIIFEAPDYAKIFFDTLDLAKGPSLGTNFTLVSPYTLYSHYKERDWAAEYGVVEHLVRISVGLEDAGLLALTIRKALLAVDRRKAILLDQ